MNITPSEASFAAVVAQKPDLKLIEVHLIDELVRKEYGHAEVGKLLYYVEPDGYQYHELLAKLQRCIEALSERHQTIPRRLVHTSLLW